MRNSNQSVSEPAAAQGQNKSALHPIWVRHCPAFEARVDIEVGRQQCARRGLCLTVRRTDKIGLFADVPVSSEARRPPRGCPWRGAAARAISPRPRWRPEIRLGVERGRRSPRRFRTSDYDLARVDSHGRARASSTADSGQKIRYCSFLNGSWKISWPQMRPRACTSAPPSLSFPSLTGANPSCLAKAATGAIASSSSLDRKTKRQRFHACES